MSEPIERDYLQVLRGMVTPQAWGEIVKKALEDAQQGNPQARAWITRLVLGADPMTLTALAVRESLAMSAHGEIEALAWGTVSEFNGLETRTALGIIGELDLNTAIAETQKEKRRIKRAAKQAASGTDQGEHQDQHTANA